MTSVFILVREVETNPQAHRTELTVNPQKGYFTSFESARSQAVGDEFPIELYRGYDKPTCERKREVCGQVLLS